MGRHAWPSRRALAQCECRVEGQGGRLAVDRLHGTAIGAEPGAPAVGNWTADREGAAGLDRSRPPSGTTALGRLPLPDHTKCFQAWGQGRSPALGAKPQGDFLLPAV